MILAEYDRFQSALLAQIMQRVSRFILLLATNLFVRGCQVLFLMLLTTTNVLSVVWRMLVLVCVSIDVSVDLPRSPMQWQNILLQALTRVALFNLRGSGDVLIVRGKV